MWSRSDYLFFHLITFFLLFRLGVRGSLGSVCSLIFVLSLLFGCRGNRWRFGCGGAVVEVERDVEAAGGCSSLVRPWWRRGASQGADGQLEMATTTSRRPSAAVKAAAAAAIQVKSQLVAPRCVATNCLGCSSPDPVSFECSGS